MVQACSSCSSAWQSRVIIHGVFPLGVMFLSFVVLTVFECLLGKSSGVEDFKVYPAKSTCTYIKTLVQVTLYSHVLIIKTAPAPPRRYVSMERWYHEDALSVG